MTDPATSSAPLDVAVAGAGAAGLALAVALKQALGPALRITAFDPALARDPRDDGRASMLAADVRRFLSDLGGWPEAASPVAGLRITDSRLDDVLRPVFLELGAEVAGEPFAHMAFDADLRAALRARAEALGVGLTADGVVGHRSASGGLALSLASGGETTARLLVAADGARSGVRERAKIATHVMAYDQVALTATLAHERPHGGIATQHFLPGGPFAMLPLDGNRSALVWSERRAAAEAVIASDDAAFVADVERRAGPAFGAITLAGRRGSFPLRLLLARSFVADRVALVADAGHVVHPLAGQGLNVGLRDVMALARIVAEAARSGEDWGAPQTLDRYERARRFDVAALGAATDALYRLFRADAARLARDVGMGLVDRTPALKRKIVEIAAGG